MDQESRRSRFNFFGNSNTDRISEEEGLRDPTSGLTSLPESTEQKAKTDRSEKYPSRQSATDFQDFLNDETKPKRPKRRRTDNSFRSQISSAWSSTKNFAVSHVYVPKVAAPWEHEVHPDSVQASQTTRNFDHRRQRRRLLVNSTFQLLVTTFLCACLVATLYGFSTVVTGMTQAEKKGFNALITGLSMLVGLNLASSLKGYAQMMRWRFLASKYRTLQDFELVMQCESQTKVFRLIWAGRTRGKWWPNSVQILAFGWILLNVAIQVVTALLGLTYSIDISDQWVFLNNNANTSISYLQAIVDDYRDRDTIFDHQCAFAHALGIEGANYPNFTSTFDDTSGGAEQEYEQNADMTEYWYRFIDRNPNDWGESVITLRTVSTTATCRHYQVHSGAAAGFDNDYSGNVNFTNSQGQNETLFVPTDYQATNSITWISVNETLCGDRCVSIWALAVPPPYHSDCYPYARLWECNNTVGEVTNVDSYGSYDVFGMPNDQARVFAGSIGWDGIDREDKLEYQLATGGTIFDACSTTSDLDMARLVMEFTAGAMAAYDFSGARNIAQHTTQPNNAQVVHVQWNWAITILAVIPGVQGLVLLAVVRWANKAVIKDTSFLATARLLRPIVEKLGPHGCLLTGDEICDTLGNYKVIYGARVPDGTVQGDEEMVLKHLDLIEETEELGKWRGRMPGGNYDGVGRTDTWDFKKGEAVVKVEEVEEEETERRKWWRTEKSRKRRSSF